MPSCSGAPRAITAEIAAGGGETAHAIELRFMCRPELSRDARDGHAYGKGARGAALALYPRPFRGCERAVKASASEERQFGPVVLAVHRWVAEPYVSIW